MNTETHPWAQSTRGKKPMPAIQRTNGEKIRLARTYLELNNYYVVPKLIGRKELTILLGCSDGHIVNLMELDAFPKPFDIGAVKRSIDSPRRLRWSLPDITAWLETTRTESSE